MDKIKEITGELESLNIAKTARDKLKDFGSFCIDTLEGDLLGKGLAYIKSATEFLNELEKDDKMLVSESSK